MLVRACESWICKVTAYVPTVPNACCAVSVDDNDVSHTPSPSQSQRACNVAVGSESEEEDASRVIESFTLGYAGENVNRAMGPGAVTDAAIDFAWTSVPLVPVMVTVYDPAFAALSVQVEV